MDPLEASSIVFSRIRKFEPQNVTNKIIGYLLLQDKGEEMIRLAFGPDNTILNLIQRVKIQLGLVPKPVISPQISPPININPISPPISPSMNVNPFLARSARPFPPQPIIRMPNPFWKPQPTEHQLMVNSNFIPDDFRFMGLDDQLDYPSVEIPFARGPRSPSEFPTKTCHYFNKGFCKHGNSCRFIHEQPFPENRLEDGLEEHVLSPASLEKLEMEITEILKMRRGCPISIASLPMIYYEKYGRTLQAEGYLTESQRHGKAGYSLTKLLARLSSIQLIDRPHGQHSVMLAEDAQKYFENRGDRNDPGPIVSGSKQIYLTFPAESSFSEEDVCEYFSTYGPVQDVRLPCQHKRMFGFVSFASADTVKTILSKGNPHYVCGARVLVKPYREKSKLMDRNYPDRFDPLMFYGPSYADINSDLRSRLGTSRFLKKPYMAEEEESLEEIRRFSELQLARKSLANRSYPVYSFGEDHSMETSAHRYNYLLDILNNDLQADNFINQTEDKCTDPESNEVGDVLPESPFAPSVASSISTAP